MNLDEFRNHREKHGPTCSVAKALKSLGPDDAALLQAALDTDWETFDGILHTEIARWLDGRGVQVSGTTVSRHRRRMCACG